VEIPYRHVEIPAYIHLANKENAPLVIYVNGMDNIKEAENHFFGQAVASAALAVNASGASDAVSYLTELEVKGSDLYHCIRAHVELTQSALYTPDELKSKKEHASRPLRRMAVNVANDDQEIAHMAVADGHAIAGGVELARTLGDLPGNICTPSHLAKTARELGKTSTKLKVSVLDEPAMKKLGMGALLSVSRGSDEPAKLISLEYSGGNKGDKPVVLVGKGVTFDSGGISIKPSAAMDEMKYDMCGAASVLGTLKACTEMALPINVVGVIPATENLPDGDASKRDEGTQNCSEADCFLKVETIDEDEEYGWQ